MKLCKINKDLVKVLVAAFTFYSVIFLVSDFQAKKTNQFVSYAQPKAAKEVTTAKADDQIEELRQLTKGQSFPWRDVIVYIILVCTGLVILRQVWVARRTRQQEVFMLLVSELNKIPFYPQDYSPPIMKRMELLGKLHNYLDGLEDVLIRERRPLKLRFLKKRKKEIKPKEKRKLRTYLDKKKWYYLRILRWYKYVQKYYISLDPKEGEILFHLKTLRAIPDPHKDKDHLALMEPFDPT